MSDIIRDLGDFPHVFAFGKFSGSLQNEVWSAVVTSLVGYAYCRIFVVS